jgi:hypothetical protein
VGQGVSSWNSEARVAETYKNKQARQVHAPSSTPTPTHIHTLTFAVRLHEMASFLTSSVVGSRCILYLARGCHRSYWACRFLPAPGRQAGRQAGSRLEGGRVCGDAWGDVVSLLAGWQRAGRCMAESAGRREAGSHSPTNYQFLHTQRSPAHPPPTHPPMVSSALGACMDSGSTQHSRRAQGEILMTSGGSTPVHKSRTGAGQGQTSWLAECCQTSWLSE